MVISQGIDNDQDTKHRQAHDQGIGTVFNLAPGENTPDPLRIQDGKECQANDE